MIYGIVDPRGDDPHIICLPPDILLECIALNHIFQGGEMSHARLQELAPSVTAESLTEDDDPDPQALVDPSKRSCPRGFDRPLLNGE